MARAPNDSQGISRYTDQYLQSVLIPRTTCNTLFGRPYFGTRTDASIGTLYADTAYIGSIKITGASDLGNLAQRFIAIGISSYQGTYSNVCGTTMLGVCAAGGAGDHRAFTDNTIVGAEVASNASNLTQSVIIGSRAGLDASGNGSVIVGAGAGQSGPGFSAANNVYLGLNSGRSNIASGNVFIGANSGADLLTNGNTFILNTISDSSKALLYGIFSPGSGMLGVNRSPGDTVALDISGNTRAVRLGINKVPVFPLDVSGDSLFNGTYAQFGSTRVMQVGINKTPECALDVVGDITTTGFVYGILPTSNLSGIILNRNLSDTYSNVTVYASKVLGGGLGGTVPRNALDDIYSNTRIRASNVITDGVPTNIVPFQSLSGIYSNTRIRASNVITDGIVGNIIPVASLNGIYSNTRIHASNVITDGITGNIIPVASLAGTYSNTYIHASNVAGDGGTNVLPSNCLNGTYSKAVVYSCNVSTAGIVGNIVPFESLSGIYSNTRIRASNVITDGTSTNIVPFESLSGTYSNTKINAFNIVGNGSTNIIPSNCLQGTYNITLQNPPSIDGGVAGSVAAGNITAGTLISTVVVPGSNVGTGINADNITTGTVAAARIPDLAASKITSGTLDAARLPASVTGAVPAGSITAYAGGVIPTGWLECDGSFVSKTTYPALFAAIGTHYGSPAGDFFLLPNLRNLTIFGSGYTYSRGQTGGAATVTLDITQIPAHTHAVMCNIGGTFSYTSGAPVVQPGSGTSGSAGGGQAHENMPPFIALIYIIKT